MTRPSKRYTMNLISDSSIRSFIPYPVKQCGYSATNEDDVALPYTTSRESKLCIQDYFNVHHAIPVFKSFEESISCHEEDDDHDRVSTYAFLLMKDQNSRVIVNNDRNLLQFNTLKLGKANEYEISSSLWFKNPNLPKSPIYNEDGYLMVGVNHRRYYNFKTSWVADYNKLINTADLEQTEGMTFEKPLILRIDNDRTTAKLRLYRKKFTYFNLKVTVSANIETDLKYYNILPPYALATKERKFVHWCVTLDWKTITYKFEVSFRTSHDSHIECNIECENCISFQLFMELYIALAGYYAHQAQAYQLDEIQPVMKGNKVLVYKNTIQYLNMTNLQKQCIDTIKHVPYVCDDGKKSSKSVMDMIEVSAVSNYVKYAMQYDSKLDNIVSRKNNTELCSVDLLND